VAVAVAVVARGLRVPVRRLMREAAGMRTVGRPAVDISPSL